MIVDKENNWELSPEQLNSCSGIDEEEGEPLEKSPQWFHYNDKTSLSGDTEQEKKEMQQAIQEQAKLGIIKLKQNKNPTPKLQTSLFNPKIDSFKQSLKESPNNIKNTSVNKYRPKIKDMRTGKVRKIGPNDPCPCGSGKKFKKCHGRGQF